MNRYLDISIRSGHPTNDGGQASGQQPTITEHYLAARPHTLRRASRTRKQMARICIAPHQKHVQTRCVGAIATSNCACIYHVTK